MDQQDNQEQSRRASTIRIAGLFLAFAPSAILMVIIETRGQGTSLGIGCVLSLLCCVVSSMMLFRRGTTWSIVFGTLLLMLNLMIAFFLGCTAMISF